MNNYYVICTVVDLKTKNNSNYILKMHTILFNTHRYLSASFSAILMVQLSLRTISLPKKSHPKGCQKDVWQMGALDYSDIK